MDYNNVPIFVAKQAVTMSDESGSLIGDLYFVRYINSELVDKISAGLNVDIIVNIVGDNEISKTDKSSIISKDIIEGTTYIDDLSYKPYVALSIRLPRNIRDIGEEGMKRVILGGLIIYLTFTTSIYLFFDKTIHERTRRLDAIVKAIPDVIFKLDKDGCFIDSEISEVDWLLADEQEFIGKNLSDIMPPNIAEKGLRLLEEAINKQTMTIQEYDLEFDGVKTYFEVRFISNNGKEAFAILRNVTELNEKTRYIEYLSYHDQLTKIHNRRYYEEQVKVLNTKENLPLTIAMIDINGLKLINDIFGHNSGDILISKVAEILQEHTEEVELLARIGGDEFIMLLPKVNHDDALVKVNDIQRSISMESVNDVTMSISIGLETKVKSNENIAENVLSHHEHWDGNGYPRKIKADNIPEISRIISIADAFEAMVNDRPYKEKISREEAKIELTNCSGTQFDPELVDIFVTKCI